MRKGLRGMGLLLVLCLFAAPAYAYIDPGTGSLVLQIVLGGLAGLAVGWRFLLRRAKELISRDRDA